MYELWLALNIFWETAVGSWPVVVGALVLWAVLAAAAWRTRAARWGAALPWTLALGAAAAVAAALWLPGWTQSSMSEMGYWLDWAVLAGLAAGVGGVVAAFAWPLMALRAGRRAAAR